MTDTGIYKALYMFIDTFCTPSLEGNIFNAYQNRFALPQNNNFAMMWVLSNTRRGTNIETHTDNTCNNQLSFKADFQVDFYGEEAFRQATSFIAMFHSNEGIEFLSDLGLAVYYADVIPSTMTIDEDNQYVTGVKVKGTFGYHHNIDRTAQTANEIKINNSEVMQ